MGKALEAECKLFEHGGHSPVFCATIPKQAEILGVSNGKTFEVPSLALTITFPVNKYVPPDGPYVMSEFSLNPLVEP